MYRLCRFFISDVTAGENLLQNAFVPVVRESGHADHGVLFAANGTCKTTVLSFLLNVFCPDQRRFVQHLQSSGDKTLDQYLIPGRPAVVMLDMANLGQPTLFETQPEEHLVLGQLLYRHRSAADKVERIFFIAHALDLFDLFRDRWEQLLDEEQPWRTVRDFIGTHVQQTTSQKEWTDTLQRLGLDPWLMERQIDFARSEGGIKDAFKFRSEDDFLDFFLGCVADMDAAVTLRDTIGKSLRKMEDRPRKIAQLNTIRELKERIVDFETLAKEWRQAQDAVESSQVTLGEATHLMKNADQTVARKLNILNPGLKEAERQRHDASSQREVVQANLSVVKGFQLKDQIARAEQEIARAREEIQGFRREENALKAADVLSQVLRRRAEAKTKREALSQANEELEPMFRRVDGLALQYHARLDGERRRVIREIDERKKRISDLDASLASSTKCLIERESQKEALEEKISETLARIRAAEESRSALCMQSGESVEDARNRLKEEIRSVEERITIARGRLVDLDEKIKIGEERWRMLHKKRLEVQAQQDRATERVNAEARQRNRLLASPHLQRVAGNPVLEPTAAELVSKLDDTIVRGRDRLAKMEKRHADLSMELKQLTDAKSLTGDAQTRKLITHYHESGISPGELKSFPEYLAGLYEAPEEIARFLESDPGRFTGIMAATEKVIEAVMELPVPRWLHRPVVLSTPCTPDSLTDIKQVVIHPADPDVYAKRHLEETLGRMREKTKALFQKIGEETASLREMEADSRDLHVYRETFPDRSAVDGLSDRVRELERTLTELASEIADTEAHFSDFRQRKADQDHAIQSMTADEARLEERLKQIESWLRQYGRLTTWQQEAEKMIGDRKTLADGIDAESDTRQRIQGEIADLHGDIRERSILLKGLDERAGDVVKPEVAALSQEEAEEAMAMDLPTLKGLFEDALRRQRHKADELGKDVLQKELDELQIVLAEREARLETLRRERAYDEKQADSWASRSSADREVRSQWLAGEIEKRTRATGSLQSEIEYLGRDSQKLREQVFELAKKGIQPDIVEKTLAGQDASAMIHRLQRESLRHEQNCARLAKRCRELSDQITVHEKWQRETQLGLVQTETFAPVWDGDSPRFPWTDPLAPSDTEETVAAVRALREQVRLRKTTQEEEKKAVDAARRRLGGGFERLQADLQGDHFRSHLPAVTDELRRHDPESLGAQAEELIRRCEDIAQNIESDLAISQQIVDNLVDMLLSRAKEYHQKLHGAAQHTIPEDVFIYGGRSILRAGTRLDFVRYKEDFKRSVENWLHELIQQDRLPEVNPRAGNCLGSELLYQLLGASTGKKTFGIRLIKCDDTGRNYEPVGKDLGSGGEALTTAVLLYTLLISMRKRRHSQPDGRIPAFLVLDNPLGVCNRSDFLDAQLKVARAMGIQCVYLTGINDRESLDLFELRVAIRKGERKIKIDGVAYDLLEITELNVEKRDGTVMA